MKKLTRLQALVALLLAVVLLLASCLSGGASDGSTTSTATGTSTLRPGDISATTPGDHPDCTTTAPSGGGSDCDHTDRDDNGLCDDCSATVIVVVDLYSFNDLHGKFNNTDTDIGIDELTTYLRMRELADDHTILLSAGDMWQGGAESNLTRGEIITDWMNDLGFVAMAMGNHEYDWGSDAIRANAELAEFPFLAINIYDRATDTPVDYCAPSVIVERGELTVGIIGAIGDCYSSISPDKCQDVYFKVGNQLTSLVEAESNRLRAQGCDLIVYLLHDGAADVSLSAGGYVDVVFEGHTHQTYVKQDLYGVYHLQGGGDNDGFSHVEMRVNVANGNKSVTEANKITESVYENLPDDPILADLLEKYADRIAKAGEELGYNSRYRDSEEILQLVARLYYEAGIAEWGDRYDIALGGGYLNTRSPYCIPAGTVLYSDLQSVLPFDNTLVLCSISGKYLSSKFFNTTNSDYYIAYGEYGAALRQNINSSATYYVIVDTYTAYYAPNNLTVVATYHDAEYYARDLLADYIREGGFDSTPIALSTIPEILAIGNGLVDNATTSEVYRTTGTVVSVTNTKYGNLVIRDGAGNTLTVYGTYDVAGTRYDSMTNPPQAGDTVVLEGPIKKYVNNGQVTVELFYATLISVN